MNALDLTFRVSAWAAEQPDKAALIANETIVSYSELNARMLDIGARLVARGVQPGSRVGVAMSAKQPFIESILGAMATGAVPIPMLDTAEGLAATATDADMGVVLVDPEILDGLRAQYPALNWESLDGLPAAVPLTGPADLSPDETGMMIYTSGTTTGIRRGVMIPNRVLVSTVLYMVECMGLSSDITELVIPPLHHAFGLGRVRAILQVGGTAVLQDGQFNPAAACVALEDFKCNALASVSSGIILLVDRFGRFFAPLGPQIKWVEIGSLPLARAQKEKTLEQMPNARIFMNYGMTEAMRTTFLEFNAETEKLDSVGSPAPGNAVCVLDEAGQAAAPGVSGRIFVSGVNMAAGYWNQMDVWAERIRDGYFDTGDFGYLDDDGYLFFGGRLDDMINVGGEKVSPIEIEDALRGKLETDTYAVAGIEDPKKIVGQVPALFVTSAEAPSEDQLRDWLRGTLAEHKIPGQVIVLDSLPRTSTGKVIRSKLRSFGA